MNQELTQKLYDKYPELFGDNPHEGITGMREINAISFDVGDGWFILIDTLIGLLCEDYKRAKKAVDENTDPMLTGMFAAELQNQFIRLPSIKQVKEKFGDLRFYAAVGEAKHGAYIKFAEAMSSSICNSCGKTGGIVLDKGWLNCQCATCRGVSDETHFHG